MRRFIQGPERQYPEVCPFLISTGPLRRRPPAHRTTPHQLTGPWRSRQAGVFGKVNNVEEVTSVLANAMDGAPLGKQDRNLGTRIRG